MYNSLTISDSLIGSLCREIDYIRERYKQVTNSLQNCKNQLLKVRLDKEITELKHRQSELQHISNEFINNAELSISKQFLYELCQRPLDYIYKK
ncbi:MULTISPECIES: hypothetical protein [Prochlorococcus]|uniref:Uncharacterized protein n=1 Tax=Prochlorococcus marinus (strain SARG / CCMP1375 / SS120) TaxID=167539 RepID=Q7VC59_PROMA|nr:MULTISPECIES: hypothetical protein [Prochlorococcus]AAP99927.1 Predicted protein [Prochlorococcus marinus subsp. marinus str. CCMP1375]KGG18861.1 hypothetical protein EV08_1347 [Prochlorococcus marinus str. SS2]KGG23601.1 hypothetical protein EV09_1226 [Prochlorococcus marinus str. SS35]KGG11725.1 hypothetical protein EV04_0750 [Prochlorococcus marinus str. LG]KGG32163.1 hypothetical protein EV10_1277 [Prochlorococcus marinus str. SS51]